MQVQLKGLPAVIAMVALGLGALGYRVFLHSSLSGDPKVRSQLELNLQHEIAGSIMADTKAISEAIEAGNKAQATRLAEGVVQRRVEIHDLAMRGSGEKIVIKAGYTVHGPAGPEKKVGCFGYSHSPITGWVYRQKVTPMSWYLQVF